MGALLSQIFRGQRYKDKKSDQCIHVDNIEEAPFVRRCTRSKYKNTSVCDKHVKYVVHVAADTGKEIVHYFNSTHQAENFRNKEVPTTWIQTNYEIPRGTNAAA